MNYTIKTSFMSLAVISLLAFTGCGHNDTSKTVSETQAVSDEIIAEQRAVLAASLDGTEGAQSPRDIGFTTGTNTKTTTHALPYNEMNLCDIHFHKGTEHRGGLFTTYAGNGDGHGYGTGYVYRGTLTEAELATYEITDDHNPLYAGDTIEVHYVYSDNAAATLGNGLETCLGDVAEGTQPSLRVEARVYVLVNDTDALDFTLLNHVTTLASGFHQANAISDTYFNILPYAEYEGSTTGPGYNEEVSSLQVSWSVSPEIGKVNIATVEEWFHHNDFDEHHAHAVRNLVTNPALLSEISDD